MPKKVEPILSPLAAALERNDRAALDAWTAQRQAEARARAATQEHAGAATTPPVPDPTLVISTEPTGQVIKLPPWAGELRACPSCVLRSALFRVIERGQRKALQRTVLAAWPGVTIRYTGWQLDQSDLDVWLTVLHMARERRLGVRLLVTVHSLLKALGRCTGKRDHEWLKGTMARLNGAVVEITANSKTYSGPLVMEFVRDEATGHYLLALNPNLVVLFEDDAFTRLEWEQRQDLSKDLTKWLHGYILSHRATTKHPHRIGLERLRELCGSDREDLRFFRRDIREAMKELQAASVVTTWRVTENDALEVVRPRRRQLLEAE
jgi:hypothetical protein